ncbi:MAG: EAL domain-containing protein [Candidatus Thiodiazotropha sp. (ex Monitilora ramsayi)]|nr:EAL domain-containing protein [Candidatus Thiodiazotropha sp. (ex Monitilora ramsayi)]
MRKLLEMIPGLDSYRGRYAYLSLLSAITLMAIAYLGWSHVRGTSQAQIQAISQRSHTAGLLVDIQTQLNRLENHLHRILLEPGTSDADPIKAVLTKMDGSLETLSDTLRTGSSKQDGLASALLVDFNELQRETERLIEVRTEAQRWFPAVRLLQDEMFPSNQFFLVEIKELEKGLSVEGNVKALEALSALTWAWRGMVEEMHHFVSYRFGVITGGFQSDAPDSQEKVEIFAQLVLTHIDALRDLHDKALLGSVEVGPIDQLMVHANTWIGASNQVFIAMEKEVWRQDLQLMRESITPIMARMRERFSMIDLRLDNDSATDITQLTQTAKQLSDSILSIAVMGILMILAAYLYINRNLLQPIAETAYALKEEARGEIDIKPPPAELRETRDLVDAFDEMRRQVHQRQRYLDHIAHHDALTQLPNRVLFRDRLEHALAIALRGETQIGLMFLDLDQFKQVNDSLGHLVGDELLQTVAERLTSLVRSSDTVARLGGDEFAILVEGINSRDDMSLLARKILRTIEQPMKLADHELRISVSVGISTAPHDDVSAEYLIRDADAAMYEAKRQGRAAYCFFSGELTSRASEGLQRETQVRQAAERDEFIFHFQPIVDCNSGELFCFEALMRWRHPERGTLHPAEFLSVLDDTGVIASVIESLMRQAYTFQHNHYRQTGEKVAIAINLSVRLLNDQVFRRQLLERLIAHDFFSDSLILEITEDILMQDLVDAEVFLQQARALGARIALDDFGTGQASLSHLRQFPFDYLKIDREFIRHADADANDASVVLAMVQLAHAFGIKVIAEGVENESQLTFLQRLDCDYIQGYLIGTPNHAEHRFELKQLMPLFG